MDELEQTNQALRETAPALHALLSDLGLAVAFPPDIPFQAAEARDKAYNATIGQITDGAGGAIPVPSLCGGLDALPADRRNQALLYSPVQGIEELRDAWMAWQRRSVGDEKLSTRPIVTVGLTHGLSIVADLFCGPGRAVAIPTPFWGNYHQTFAVRRGARIVTAPAYVEGAFDPGALAAALGELGEGEPAVALLNLPSNPGGYSATEPERARLVEALAAEAERRALLVVCDDAYAGLVYEPDVPARSIFWDLHSVHPNLVPVKVDGGTKEFSYFGGRVGFLTFPFAPDSVAAAALESKIKGLLRSTVGSPVATAQVLLLEALKSGRAEAEVERVREILAARYRVLRDALAEGDDGAVRALPFNSGCFALLELAGPVSAGRVRRHLLDRHDTGIVSIEPNYLRIAFCSVAEEALPEVVRRIRAGVAELA